MAQGSSVAQQQMVRDFSTSRTRALKDIINSKPITQRAGLPGFKSRKTSLISLNYTTRGFSLKPDTTGKISIPVVWSRTLLAAPSSVRVSQDSRGHLYASFVIEAPEAVYPATQGDYALGLDWGCE
ncbi:hypothetical protein [Arthrobacter sp. MYb227]|uniref:hypothetical protein n=1 Tax=Arthrobacter sp. MYb227 TaxID=1848601 RepID=UPI001C614D51|nr:hypothetical protein [Arthrobacter sp. MYb227]